MLAALEARGVAVRVLTNAWQATDVPLVHAAYLGARPFLIEAGVELLELRATAALEGPAEGGVELASANPFGLSAASLHAKTVVWDQERVFVGSMNFDPRSARLNTEMGVLIDSTGLAGLMGGMLDDVAPGDAYRVEMESGGRLVWVAEGADGSEERRTPEPGTTPLLRLALWTAGHLPIEWLL